MKARLRAAGLAGALAVASLAPQARAALTASEAEQVRGYVAEAAHADRVRALVARTDLSPDESAAAMAQALAGIALDDRHAAYLEAMVHGAPSPATRPVLAVATVRGLLARVDALLAAHPADLDRAPGALGEIGLAYRFAAGEVAATDASMTDAARADVGRALLDHMTRNAALLRLDAPVPLAVARLRAQLAVSIADSLPDGPTRKIDAADRLGLTGARRAALVDLGLLVADRGGTDDRIAEVRAVAERLPGARDGAEAVFVGDDKATFRARAAVVATADASGPLGEAASPWGGEAAPPAVSALTMAVARGLGAAAVGRALEKRPGLRVLVDRDGGAAGVVTLAAMLAVDAPRTVDVAAARFIAGRRESAAWLSDALGALAAFARVTPSSGDVRGDEGRDGLVVPLSGAGVSARRVVLDPNGAAAAFRLAGHLWRLTRDDTGAVTAFTRDGAPVALAMLPTARVAATDGSQWSGAGLVFARLAGTPRVAIAAGPRVRVVGATAADAISTPAPGDDVTLDADVHLDGGPGGILVHALPAARGFRGISLLLVPGSPGHAALMAADGSGNETAASPVVEIAPSPSAHVTIVVKGKQLTAQVGPATLSLTLPDALLHGDVGLRAYPGVTLEVSGWRLAATNAPRRH